MKNTISIHVGNTSSIIHNNRKTKNHTNPDIDVSRPGDNITLVGSVAKFKNQIQGL